MARAKTKHPETTAAIAAEPATPIVDQAEPIEPARPGRPKGRKTEDLPEAELRPAQCPSCKSTRRGPFRDGRAHEQSATVELDGKTYNRQIWRITTCLDCGQRYRVIEYRFEHP